MPPSKDDTLLRDARLGQLLNAAVQRYEAEYPKAQIRRQLLCHVASAIKTGDMESLERLLPMIVNAAAE